MYTKSRSFPYIYDVVPYIFKKNMIGRIYSKNLTFLQDQPFAENLLTGISYKKNKKAGVDAASTTRDPAELMPIFPS